MKLYIERFTVTDAKAQNELVEKELQNFRPLVTDPAQWHSVDVLYLLSHASQQWQLKTADALTTFIKQLPVSQATSLTRAYTDFGL